MFSFDDNKFEKEKFVQVNCVLKTRIYEGKEKRSVFFF